MDTAPYPAWDNRQIAHFLCRADRRVLSQPHAWLHAGVGAIEPPAESQLPVQTIKGLRLIGKFLWKVMRWAILKLVNVVLIAIIQILTSRWCPFCDERIEAILNLLDACLRSLVDRP